MGGKTKTSQRTKNNARPSSSGRSAELLNNAANLDPSLLAGGKMMSALFPTLATPALDQGLPSEFSICIKKLNKKDPITKVKALQELSDLVSNGKVDDVVLILPSWAHFYKILSVDTDCKVREMAQMCHGRVTAACGRQLAPLLRQLVPAWLQAQHDDHAPAAAHADRSLKGTFPENKLPEVISFCKAEVMAHLTDSLIGNAQKTLIKPAEDAEERSLQLQRLSLSSFQGLRYFAASLPAAHHAWLWERLQPLLAAPAFWKYASHSSQHLRAAWFASMSVIVERFASTFAEEFGARLLKVTLAAAHDAPPPLALQAWGCLLHFMYAQPDWHKYLDKKDLLVKRIFDMLEKGGWGDAKRLTDMILPLLAHLPQDMLTKQFYEAFFNAYFKGLEKKSILSSKSERQHWITSIAECLRYLSIQQNDLSVELTSSVHRTWLKTVLSTEREGQLKTNLIKHSATSMVALVKYWLKQSKEVNGEKYDQLIRNFWQNVGSTVLAQIDKPEGAEIGPIVDGHILLLQTLKQAFLSETKKVQSIKFDGDTPTKAEVKAPVQEIDVTSLERYNHNLNEVVEKICCNYFEYADKNDISDPILTPLISILNEFDSKNLYMALARHFSATSVHEFYEKVLMKWMLRDTMRSKTIVDIIFILMKHLTEEEQDAVVSSFDKVGCGVVEWCVGAALCHSAWDIVGARRWLKGATVRDALLAATRRLLRQRCARAKHLLLVGLCTDGKGEMLISEETASEIAEVVSDALCECLSTLATETDLDLEHCASVAAHLVTALAPRSNSLQGYERLVRELFEVVLQVPRGCTSLSVGGWCEARSAAHDGLCARPAAARHPHIARLAAHRDRLVDEVNVPQIEHITSLCPYLLSGCSTQDHVAEAVQLTKLLLDFNLEPSVEIPAVRHDVIVGRFNCPFNDDNEIIRAVVQESDSDTPLELTKKVLVPNINKVIFRALYLKTILLNASTDEDEEKLEDNSWCDMLFSDEVVQLEFCKLLRECMVVYSLDEAYGFWLHHDIIREAKNKLDTIIDEILSATLEKTRIDILSRLLELAATEGYYWACARRFYEVKVDGGAITSWDLDANICSDDKSEQNLNLDNKLDDKSGAGDSKTDNQDAENRTEDKSSDANSNLDEDSLRRMINGKGYYHCLQANTQWSTNSQQRIEYLFCAAVRSLLAGFPAAANDEIFSRVAVTAARNSDLDPFADLYHRLDPTLLGERDIVSAPWGEIVAEVALIDCIVGGLQKAAGGWDAPSHHWDLATVTLCALVTNLWASREHCDCTKVAMVARATFRLYMFVQDFISKVRSRSVKRQPSTHVADLPAEWRDVFACSIHRDLYALAVALLESPPTPMTYSKSRILTGLSRAIRVADWNLIDSAHKNSSLQLSTLVDKSGAALAKPLPPPLHCLAAAVLAALGPCLARHDEEQISSWSVEGPEGSKSRPTLALDWFHPHLTTALQLTDAALAAFMPGVESCTMSPAAECHGVALGALLLATALHDATAQATGALTHHYMQMFRDARYVETLLPVSLRLLPAPLLAAAQSPSAPLPDAYRYMFHQAPQYDANDSRWRNAVSWLACRGVFISVGGLGGAAARGWWGAAGRAARPLARLVAAYVTGTLVNRQMQQLTPPPDLEDLEIRVHRAAREVVAEFTVEERRVELWIKFGPEYPLTPPTVEAPCPRPSVSVAWIPMYIAYQNGTVLNAIKMWSEAISSHVESAPQCYICYCRLHPTTGHLPNVPCHQCRNRFHTPCLHKWFVSSHRSNCPLCRSSF